MVKKNYDDMLSRFHLVPERNGRTDGRTKTDLLDQYRALLTYYIYIFIRSERAA